MIKISRIWKTSYACPAQWEGIVSKFNGGGHVYFRYRHGELSHGYGKTFNDALNDSRNTKNRMQISEDENDGMMNYENLIALLKETYIFPKVEQTNPNFDHLQ